jgi:hypothetical protein
MSKVGHVYVVNAREPGQMPEIAELGALGF